MKIPSLAAYSAASGLLLALPPEASGQMTYYNIDPDATIFGDIDYPIDLNLDGIPEMTMHANRWWTFTSDEELSNQLIQFLNYAEIATSAGPMQLYSGDVVDADLDFNSDNLAFFYGYNEDGWIDIDSGTSWINNDSYIGLRFDVSGNTHYGWIRLRLHQTDVNDMPGLIVKELAWNATPDAPAPINLHVGTAQFPTLADVGETNTAADLQLHFEKPEDESNVVVYRVIVYPGYDEPTLAEANAVTSERYTQVLPTGDDITINFNETTLDINGNPLISGTYYQAIILSIPDGIIVTGRDLSLPSNSMYFNLQEAPVAEDIYLSSTGYEHDITGLYGNFTMDYTNVSSVRAYLTDGSADLEELLLLNSDYYMELTPVVGDNLVSFTTDKLIYTSGAPVLFETYFLNIVSIPDNITNSFPAYDYDVSYFKYLYYAVTPTVAIVDTVGDGSAIQVNFPMFNNEEYLELYRIFVAKADAVIYPEDAYDLSAAKRIDIIPTGTDIDINLGDILLDTDGQSIKFNEPYKVYVALKAEFYPDYYSLSEPSAEFILTAPLQVDTIENTIEMECLGSTLHVMVPNLKTANMQIVNAAGVIVYQSKLVNIESAIDLSFLPAGMYIATVTTENEKTNFVFPLTK